MEPTLALDATFVFAQVMHDCTAIKTQVLKALKMKRARMGIFPFLPRIAD